MRYFKLIDIKHARRAGFHNPCGIVTDIPRHKCRLLQLGPVLGICYDQSQATDTLSTTGMMSLYIVSQRRKPHKFRY